MQHAERSLSNFLSFCNHFIIVSEPNKSNVFDKVLRIGKRDGLVSGLISDTGYVKAGIGAS